MIYSFNVSSSYSCHSRNKLEVSKYLSPNLHFAEKCASLENGRPMPEHTDALRSSIYLSHQSVK